MRKSIFFLLFNVLMLNSAVFATTLPVSAPADVAITGKKTEDKIEVANFASEVLKIVKSSSTEDAQLKEFQKLLKKYFDLPAISTFCMGRHHSELLKTHKEQEIDDLSAKILAKFCLALFKSCGADKNASCSVTKGRKVTSKQGGKISVKHWVYVSISANDKDYEVMFIVSDNKKIEDAKSENVSMTKTIRDQIASKISDPKEKNKSTFEKIQSLS